MDEPNGQDDQAALHDARRRIVAAFEGIAAGTEALAQRAADAPDPSELERLRAEVEEERMANAQLSERIRALRERGGDRGGDEGGQSAPEDDQVAALESRLAQAQEEIASLEALRAADRDEMDAVLAELMPIVKEAR